MTYDIYSSANCSSLISTLGVVTVTNGSAPDSPDWTAVGPAGTVYFVASYSGDVNNASAVSGCAADPVSVNQNAPSISTSLSATTVGIGGSVDDTATLSGSGAAAGGTVTYDVYSGASCTGLVATLGPVTVTNGVVPNSPDWTPTSAGTDYFVASYSGDANNAPAVSGCAAEPVTVSPNAPTVSTQLSVTTVTLGGTVYDAATLAGATTERRWHRDLQGLLGRHLLRTDHHARTADRHQRQRAELSHLDGHQRRDVLLRGLVFGGRQ